jgi:hypothetical protein
MFDFVSPFDAFQKAKPVSRASTPAAKPKQTAIEKVKAEELDIKPTAEELVAATEQRQVTPPVVPAPAIRSPHPSSVGKVSAPGSAAGRPGSAQSTSSRKPHVEDLTYRVQQLAEGMRGTG